MGKIKVLPDELINVIAAGEVVERPASVVKELLENAIDAQSSKIEIVLQKAGKVMIRVIDDGIGMSAEDAFLALERHATSKIKSKEDLFRIQTMGFRGEALPSIASVSKFVLITRERDSNEPAIKIYCEGGQIIRDELVQHPYGTTIEVQRLFYNVPARKKQLASDNTELMHILEVVNRIALANPTVQFVLSHNGKRVLQYPSRQNLLERLMDVFSLEFSKSAIEVNYSDEYMKVYGYISTPQDSRKDWNQQYVFVNKRYVASRIIRHAIDVAYDTLLPRNRYPKGVIFIDLPPEEVDVNVHPTKIQVRFLNANRVHDTLAAALRGSLLKKMNFAAGITTSGPPPDADTEVTAQSPKEESELKREIQQSIENFFVRHQHTVEMPTFERQVIHSYEKTSRAKTYPDEETKLQVTKILGQIMNSYIVVETEKGFALVDQHAAHERIRYEHFLRQYENGRIATQELLLPISVEVGHREKVVIDELIDELEKFGFKVSEFGLNTYKIDAAPAILQHAEDIKSLFYEIMDEYITGLKKVGPKERIDELLKLISCKGAIKANMELPFDEMRNLIEQLLKCNSPFTCPHGRPTIIRFDQYHIEKMFKRVM